MSTDYVVYIGRFQPFHAGHQVAVETALKESKKKVILLVGSAGQPRSVKNPWTFEERKAMIRGSVMFQDIVILPLYDCTYGDQQWVKEVQSTVQGVIRRDGWTDKEPSVGIIGYEKDETSYYLSMFPQWERITHEVNEVIDATDIRGMLFEEKSLGYLKGVVGESVMEYIRLFKKTEDFTKLQEEHDFVQRYKKQWAGSPYPPTFLTVDAIVIQSGHVLLVRRGANPGKGSWALPGGFVDQNETCEAAALRELREETRLKVPLAVLQGSIKAERLFDNPWRSLRGRTVTQAFLMELKPGTLPVVKGGDDADKAEWVPLSNLRTEEMYEDHYHIIQWFIGRL